jgi:ubiquinol-cytochrome c reductase subunit 7
LLNSSKPAIAEAMELADADIIMGRMRRLKRASDLSFKGKVFTDYQPNAKLEPWKEEMWEDVLKLQKRDEEYEIVNLHKK